MKRKSCDFYEYEEGNNDDSYEVAERGAFQKLFSYIRTELIPHPKVLTMTELKDKLISYVKSNGVSVVKDATKKHICHRLKNELGSAYSLMTMEGFLFILIVSHQRTLQRKITIWKRHYKKSKQL